LYLVLPGKNTSLSIQKHSSGVIKMTRFLSSRSLRGSVIAGSAAACLSTGLFVVLAAPFGGAVYTTDSAGAAVNENIFNGAGSVYINGGPNNSSSSGLPANEVFYFEVTDPSGRTLLSKDNAICRQVRTDVNGRISGVESDPACPTPHAVGTTDAANGGVPVKLAPFNQTPNEGGEYKVTLVRKSAPGVTIEADGKHLDYARAATKSDNFKVMNYTDDGGGGPTDPSSET
jgi:hypothetical protein